MTPANTHDPVVAPSPKPNRPKVGHSSRGAQSATWAQRGQATAEYALVLLGAAAVAVMLAAWAAKSGMIGKLFDAVVGQLISKAG